MTDFLSRSALARVPVLLTVVLMLAGCSSVVASPSPSQSTSGGVPSQADSIEMMSSCLEEAGWDINNRSTGEVIVPPEQMSVFEEDSQGCIDEVSSRMGWSSNPLTERELGALYDLEVAAAECLRGMGYMLEVPTLQTFIDSYKTEPFIAHVAIGQLSQTAWKEATEECPPAAWTYQR